MYNMSYSNKTHSYTYSIFVLVDFNLYTHINCKSHTDLKHCRESDYLATQLINQVSEIKVIIKILKYN